MLCGSKHWALCLADHVEKLSLNIATDNNCTVKLQQLLLERSGTTLSIDVTTSRGFAITAKQTYVDCAREAAPVAMTRPR
jgi:hypothetical protein